MTGKQVQSQAEMISAGCYSRGKTPLDLARKEGHKKVVRILLNLPAWAPQTMGFPGVFGVGGWNKAVASELENMGYEVEIFWEHTLSLGSILNLQILDECRSHVTRIVTHSTLGYPLVCWRLEGFCRLANGIDEQRAVGKCKPQIIRQNFQEACWP